MDVAKIILGKYQVRKTKKQKEEFIEFTKEYSDELGYECNVEKGMFGSRNIVVGDPETANTVYTAHYDTCTRLPFPNFITPKKISMYLAYQLVITAAFLAVLLLLEMILGFALGMFLALTKIESVDIKTVSLVLSYICLFGVITLFFGGPANKNTANDNTSGVITLFEIMRKIEDVNKNKVAFIFFDHEESGLFGSAGYASKHKNVKKDKLLINFDCVSDGNNILFVLRKGREEDKKLIEKYFAGDDEFSVEVLDKGVFYPSDQANFNRGVGVAALKYSKKLKTLYMDKIHTKNDTVFEEKNIEFLSDCAAKLVSN